MSADEDNRLFPRPHCLTWHYITLLVQIIFQLGDRYELRPAMPPTVLPIVVTSITAAALPFAMSRRD
jgi:hypothetical protein